MDLELLKRFYITAQEGAIGRAAQKLNVAQSALTRSIQLFEHRMKTQLFERTPKGVRLTPQGERLFAFAKKMMEDAESFERSFYEKDEEIEGEIKIITNPFLGSAWLMPKLKKFLEKYPKVRVKILVKLDNIDPNEADVTICPLFPRQPQLIQQYLFTPQLKLFATPVYLKKFGIPTVPEDLDNHRLITYKGDEYSSYGPENWVLNIGVKEGQASRKSYIEIDLFSGMLSSALEGYGIVELFNFPSVLNSGLVEILPQIEGPKVDIYYIFPESRQKSKKINILLKYLTKKE